MAIPFPKMKYEGKAMEFMYDIDNLSDDMAGEDVDPKSSASAAAVPYVFLLFLLDFMTQFFALVLPYI